MGKREKVITCCILSAFYDMIENGYATLEEITELIPKGIINEQMNIDVTDEEIKEEAKKILFSYQNKFII